MDRTVAGRAFRCVGVATFRGLPVDAGGEILHFVGMTLHALCGHQLFRGGEFVHASVTGSAGGCAEDGVGTGGEGLGFVRMASGALDF